MQVITWLLDFADAELAVVFWLCKVLCFTPFKARNSRVWLCPHLRNLPLFLKWPLVLVKMLCDSLCGLESCTRSCMWSTRGWTRRRPRGRRVMRNLKCWWRDWRELAPKCNEKKATGLQRYQSIESEREKWENHECWMVRELDKMRKEKEDLIDCHPFSSMMS